MFNGEVKRKSLKRLQTTNNYYQAITAKVTESAGNLHQIRRISAQKVIQDTESYINMLANSPKEFEKTVGELKISYQRFEAIIRQIQKSDNVFAVGGTTVGAGILAGTGVAAFGPTAAMAIATTFGTASTGTAISALSGAAATNAALAWLGGGALAAGGGGMAAGNAILLLAGPVGWTIGGTALVGGALWARKKNKDIAEKANQETIMIRRSIMALKTALEEIDELFRLTKKHSEGVTNQLSFLKNYAPTNYSLFTDEMKNELGALINNIRSLSQLLMKNIR